MLEKNDLLKRGIDENLLNFLVKVSEEKYFLDAMKEMMETNEEEIEAFDDLIEEHSKELARFQSYLENIDEEEMDVIFTYLLQAQIRLYENFFEV